MENILDNQLGEPCYLLSLPAELRNKIWAQVISCTDEEGDPEQLELPRTSNPILLSTFSNHATQPALTRVNRQIRGETLPIFDHINNFSIVYCPWGGGDFAVPWLRSLGEHAKYLRTLHTHQPNAKISPKCKGSFRRLYQTTRSATFQITVDKKLKSRSLDFAMSTHFSAPELDAEVEIFKRLDLLAGGLRRRFEGENKKALTAKDWINILQCIDRVYGSYG